MANTTKALRPRRKARYHIRNWRDYERALVKRGALTLWVDAAVASQWWHVGPKQRGAQPTDSDVAIETVLTLKEVFHLPNRASEGLARSLLELLGLDLDVPDHSTLSRRGQTVRVRLPRQATGPLHAVLDSSGLKVYGEGEWKVRQHDYSKRRTLRQAQGRLWRKIHLAVDADASEIEAALLTEAGVHDAEAAPLLLAQLERPLVSIGADGAYDRQHVYETLAAQAPNATLAIPPRRDANIQQHGNCQASPLGRDVNLRYLRQHGRAQWKREHG
ncbi:MAG: IS5 family transposase, partial [Anaerolineales bacterium]